MYYYFSSNYPAVIKLNGIYYGSIHNAVKSCNLEVENPFVELCPLNGSQSPACFIIDQNFLAHPPEQVVLTDMDGGYMLFFNGGFSSPEFKVLCQQKFSDAVVTVFSENGYKLSIETASDFYAESLYAHISSAKISRYKNLIAVEFFGDKSLINIYGIRESVTKLFSREAELLEFGEKVIIKERLNDMAKHIVTTEWALERGEFALKNKSVESDCFDREKLNIKVVPYAFLEEMLAGGDFTWCLGGTLKENADKLRGFLGEFIGVMPPPVFRGIDEVGLIYFCERNFYKVKYFKFELKEGKIVNIIC